MAPLSTDVAEAGVAAIRAGQTPFRLGVDDFFAGCDVVRARFADLIGLSAPERVAVIPAVSYGTAIIARNTRLERHQNVVTLGAQFPSNVHVWRMLCERAGAQMRVVAPPVEGPGRAAAWNEAILDAIDGDTALVAIGSVHWEDGTRFELARIGERAREVGAAFVVDGTQSVGADPFDIQAVRPDALICAGYKWLTGPYSIGVAYIGERYEEGSPLEETWMSREGSDDFAGLAGVATGYRSGAARYDVGESANFILVPMLGAALEQLLGWGVADIAAYVRALRDELLASPRLEALGVDARERGSAHLFGLRLPSGKNPEQVRADLAARSVHVSVRGRVVRVAPYVYNDSTDVDALVEGLEASLL
jgi:selenocysteine lyase/cysteine desulfurase